MSSPDDPVKKIVSKREYAQIQSVRVGRMLWGMSLVVAGVACAVFTLCLCVLVFASLADGDSYRGLGAFILICAAVLTGVLTYGFGKMGAAKIEEAEKLNYAVPLTKANAPYLPMQESLVRASAEPLVAAETVLLRAAADNSTTPPEQLVRSSNSPT